MKKKVTTLCVSYTAVKKSVFSKLHEISSKCYYVLGNILALLPKSSMRNYNTNLTRAYQLYYNLKLIKYHLFLLDTMLRR